MTSFCGCGSECCECKDKCSCCTVICDCTCCIEIRKTQLCEKCGQPYDCRKSTVQEPPKESKPIENFAMYPGVRFDKLPDLDFLNPKLSSGATGNSSKNHQPNNQYPVSCNSQIPCYNSSSEDDSLIFQMDDIDTSLPSIEQSSFPRSHSSPGSLNVGIQFGAQSSNGNSRQLKVQRSTVATQYSPSKLPKHKESLPLGGLSVSESSPPREFNVSESSPPREFNVSESSPPRELSISESSLPRGLTVTESWHNSQSLKKSPNSLSKSESEIFDNSSLLLKVSDSKSTKQTPPEIETKVLCSNGKEVNSISASKPSDEEANLDENNLSKK